MRTVTLLGSTGPIGTGALEVMGAHPDRFSLTALAAGAGDLALAAEQAVRFGAEALALTGGDRREAIAAVDHARRALGVSARPEVLVGPEAAATVAGAGVDVVLDGLTGSAGLGSALAALRAGSTLALVGKETLVIGGALLRPARVRPDQLVPLDPEHSAIAPVLRAGGSGEVARLLLTAWGGPFHGRSRAELERVRPHEVLAPPRCPAGPIGTTNSATLLDAGLGLIAAHLFFDMPTERIDVIVHPEAIVHSLVEFVDGSTNAQASPRDPRVPIALGLSWPDRLAGVVDPCDWREVGGLTFEPADHDTFPAIGLCRAAVAASATHPAVLHAANEEAVAAFLDGRLPFPEITGLVAHVLDDHEGLESGALDLERLGEVVQWARGRARELVDDGAHR